MSTAAVTRLTVQDVYDGLMAARRGDAVEETLAQVIASWTLGDGGMPAWLGLGEAGFRQMLTRHFPALPENALPCIGIPLDPARFPEIEDLRALLVRNRTDDDSVRDLMVDIVVAGCMGNDHLWQDLGLWSRADLSMLMREHFAPLAARNDRDMKWKKFLYKQLCEAEGIYVCRSPSCEVCTDYAVCFGPED